MTDLGAIRPDDHLFFALLPDEPARNQALAVSVAQQLRHGAPTYRVPDRCFHITLGGAGLETWLDPKAIAAAMAAADRVSLNAFRVELNRVEGWGGPSRPWVLTGEDGVIGIHRLRERLRLAWAVAGLGARWAANFTPHLTLMRGGPEMAPDFVIEHVAPIRWTVREFVLVHSHVGEGRYTILRRWPLGSPLDTGLAAAYPNRAA